MLSTESVWSNQHTDRLAVARPAKRHVGLAVGKAVRSLIDQHAGECLPLRLCTEMAASMNSHAAAVPHTGSRNVLMHRSVQLYSYSALPVLHVARVYMHSYVRQ